MLARMKKGALGLVLFCSLWGFARQHPEPKFFLPVPLIRQSTEYSCGPAALLAVLAYYGISDFNETDLMTKAKTTEQGGTDITDLTQTAEGVGLKARWQEHATLDQLRASLSAGHPVIVAAQAWPPGIAPKSFSAVWEDGHYLVVVGMDSEFIYFMDPSHLGSRGYWTLDSFLERWHDTDGKEERLHHLAIFFQGTPQPPSAWLPIP